MGEYVDSKTFAALMVVRTDSVTGDNNEIEKDSMRAYAISNNTLVSVSDLGPTPLDFVGFGHFSSQFALGMLMREPTTGEVPRTISVWIGNPSASPPGAGPPALTTW